MRTLPSKIQYRLNVAGNPPAWDVNRILGLKVLGLAMLRRARLPVPSRRRLAVPTSVLLTAASRAFGYVLPNILLYNAGQKRDKLMRNTLPDAMDLLTISVEAGLGFDAAVGRVAKNREGPLARSSRGCCRRCRSAWAGPTRCGRWPSAPRCRT